MSTALTPRRRWVTLTLATVLVQFSYWPIVGALTAGGPQQAGLLWLGLAITPFVCLVVAFGSGHPRAAGATGKAMGVFLLVALPLGMLNTIVGLVAGYGAGAVVALRPGDEPGLVGRRVIAVVAASVYVLVLLLLSGLVPALGPFAVVSGAVVPLAVVGIADELGEGLAQQQRQPSPH